MSRMVRNATKESPLRSTKGAFVFFRRDLFC